MKTRPIDAVQVLSNINWHHKPTPVSEFESGFNQGLNQAMWIITHAPTLTQPNELFTCAGCCYLNRVDTPCAHCIRSAGCADYFRRLPGKEE